MQVYLRGGPAQTMVGAAILRSCRTNLLSLYTDTEPASPSVATISPDAWQSSQQREPGRVTSKQSSQEREPGRVARRVPGRVASNRVARRECLAE